MSFTIFLITATITLGVCLYLYFTRKFKYWEKRSIPYIKPLPFLGNIKDTLLLKKSIGELFEDFYQTTTKPVLGFFIMDSPCLLIRDPALIKRVLIHDFSHFYDRVATDNKRDDPIGSHILFILRNPDWKEIRAKMTPVFTSAKMRMMSKLVDESAKDLVNYLGGFKSDQTLEARNLFSKYSIDVISSTSFGVNARCFEDEEAPISKAARKIFDFNDLAVSIPFRCYFLAHSLVKLFRMKLFYPKSIEFLRDLFLGIMDERVKTGNKRNDLIDILIQLKKEDPNFELAGDKLVAQAVVFFIAGFETSSSALAFTFYELAVNTEIQKRLRNEIMEIIEKYGEINYDAIREMTYMDMCLTESLRIYPVLPFLDRRCNKDYEIPELNLTIEKGTPIFIPVGALHKDPQYYPDPEKFDPERFSNNSRGNDCTYLPFGQGPRNCIGARFARMSVKFALAFILKDFEVEISEKMDRNLKFDPKGVTNAPLNGIHLKFRKILL